MLPLLYIPERSKQHARRLPDASMSQAVAMRLTRVTAFLPDVIQWIQSRRATAVRLFHTAFASGAAASALRTSAGTTGSGYSFTGAITRSTRSPATTPADARSAFSTFSQ